MALTFVATLYDGVLLKQFTMRAEGNLAACETTVVFDGAGGRPHAFDVTKLCPVPAPGTYLFDTGVVRHDAVAATAGTGQYGIRDVTENGCIVHKITASGSGNDQLITVTIDARHSIGR
jgi:hypothetical protein